MKSVFWLIYITLVLPVIANDPGRAALDFLQKVKSGDVDLSPGGDTALQVHTSQLKVKSIDKRLKQLSKDLKSGSLEVSSVREDEGFAAAIVRKTGGFDASHLQVFPVALIKTGDLWLPAPVLASYENAVPAYTVALKGKLNRLEAWMMKERVLGLEELISEFSQRTRDQIKENIVGEELEGDDLERIAQGFLDACLTGNQGAMLGFLGGLSDPLPEDWASRIRATELAVSDKRADSGPWRLLVSDDVLRVVVHKKHDGKNGLVSVACLDPAKAGGRGTMGKIVLLHFDVSKNSAGQWQMDLPSSLLNNDEEELIYDDELDVDLLDRFTIKLREKNSLLAALSARQACEAVLEGLKGGKVEELLRRVDFSGSPKEARFSAAEAAEVWWSMNEPGALRVPVELGFKREGDLAIAVYQWFSIKQADQYVRKSLYFKKVDSGWMWATGPVAESERKSRKILSAWIQENEEEWRIKWRKTLLRPSYRLNALSFDTLADEQQVKSIITGWISALNRVDLQAALSCSAWLGADDTIPMKALRNLSYELGSSAGSEFTIEKIYHSDSWIAASVKAVSEKEVRHAFIPVVVTSAGPRILPEIDLLSNNNRSRKFLNKTSFQQLEKFTDQEKVTELRGVFEMFQKEVSASQE